MSGYAAATQLATTLQTALDLAGVSAQVTLDPSEASALLGSGQVVGLVNPPRTTWETWAVAVHQFDVFVLSDDHDPMVAWPVLDQLGDEISERMETDTSQLTLWQPSQGEPWPALHLTLDTTTHQE